MVLDLKRAVRDGRRSDKEPPIERIGRRGSRAAMTTRIVFQGEPGANSHLAIREAYPDAEAVPCPTFEDCFGAITSGDAKFGMIPIENSVAGRVADIHHLMPHSGLHIVGEHFMPVRHQLLGVKGSALEIAAAADKSRAAIASRLAADIYGLTILQEDIEDEAHNTTRFIVLARDAKWAPSGSGPIVTTFLFRVRNVPAALYKVLGGFATNGVNMTKLESYM